ncbi:MAG: ABC transporter substrate-binding protein [Gracilibacteraceae bacterium]|jgi:peptide/nickel transport system substrate-binding protein|nr:ABC transporter substrate-binding protein [Gracilibacteraceae bacterium]
MKKSKKILCLLQTLALLCLLLLAAACGSSDPVQGGAAEPAEPAAEGVFDLENDFTVEESVAIGLQEGSLINVASNQDFLAHLPWQVLNYAPLHRQVFEGLFYFEDGDVNKLAGCMAESWEWDQDDKGITVKLHDNIKFSNGRELTAQDCIDCWEYTEKYQPAYFRNIESIEAVDEYTLYFKFLDYYANFQIDFSEDPTSIVDPRALDEYGPESNNAAVGTGPYVIASYTQGSLLVLRANEYYWFAPKAPHIETVNIHYIPDENTTLVALQNGDIDFFETQNVQTLYACEDDPNLNVAEMKTNALTLWINESSDPLLQISEVREALGHMIDWQDACDIVYDGLYKAATGYWVSGTFGYVENSKNWEYDPEYGLQLLEEAGVDPSDLKLEIMAYPKYKDIYIAVQAQLAGYGIQVDVPTLEPAIIVARHREGNYNLAASWIVYTPSNPINGFTSGMSPQADRKTVWIDVSNPGAWDELMTLYEAAYHAPTLEEQYEGCREMTAFIQDNFCNIGGFEIYKWIALSKKFANAVYTTYDFYPCYYYMYEV